MKALLLQLDGKKLPNLALMRVAAHHRALGHDVELRYVGSAEGLSCGLWQEGDVVRYASLLFERTRPVAEELLRLHPDAIVGGTGWSVERKLEDFGIRTRELDYSIYPNFAPSIGFTQRGCRLKCGFCVVPRKEGAVREAETVQGLYRGEPHARDLVLLDNDFFGQRRWRQRVREIRGGGFRVSFCQGINARTLTSRQARAMAGMRCYDDEFEHKRVYCAWDSRPDEARLVRGLGRLERAGVNLDNVTVYVLVGYDHATRGPRDLHEDDFHRVRRLRELGARPYPMPYVRSRESAGFARWVRFGHDERVSWADWVAADYRAEKLGLTPRDPSQRSLFA